jgi:hypothetical protein
VIPAALIPGLAVGNTIAVFANGAVPAGATVA